MPLPILKFTPILLPKPWGGNALYQTLGKGLPQDEAMGESWELSDRPEADSTVAAGCGEFSGRKLSELLLEFGPELVGKHAESAPFPLLYKFICAREKLSVQVHPGTGSTLGEAKTECWVVIDAEPGAELIVGISPQGLSRTEIIEALKSAQCESVLRRWPAKRGDVFFIPAGTVHAITEGLLLYEVQQNSDTTFRLYDWGRVDAQGKSRALHLQEAAAVADLEAREGFSITPLQIIQATHVEDYLVACPFFALVKWRDFKRAPLETHGRFRVVTAVAGTCLLESEKGDTVHLQCGETALIPASMPLVYCTAISPDAELIISFVPKSPAEIETPLLKAGYAKQAISTLFGPSHFQV